MIKKIKMCRIGHSSALCGRELPQELARFKTGNHSNAGKQTPRSPIPTRAPRATAIWRRRAFGRDIIHTIILYYYI